MSQANPSSKFLMDYDNIPGKGPLMLFKDNGDGTQSLATVDDVKELESALAEAEKEVERLRGFPVPHDVQELWQKELPYLFSAFHKLMIEYNEQAQTILRMRTALTKIIEFNTHYPVCAIWRNKYNVCNCGYDEAKEALREEG